MLSGFFEPEVCHTVGVGLVSTSAPENRVVIVKSGK